MNFLRSNKGKHFTEHHGWYHKDEFVSEDKLFVLPPPILFMGKADSICFAINPVDRKVYTGYYIGVDWVQKDELAVYVQPKLNERSKQANYLKMLFDALKHQEIRNHTDTLFELKIEETFIEIEEHQDLITPLLVLQFLQIVKDIVRRGLKKGYYRKEDNIYGRVKGKVLVAKTIKENLLKNKTLYTTCAYDKFGADIPENKLLKKALTFSNKYLAELKIPGSNPYLKDVYHFISPAFEEVSDDISGFEIKHFRNNPFYKEYKKGIELAQLILKRFGYNITNTHLVGRTKVPPFWIDMSKLFELYVLGILKDKYHEQILFQSQVNYGQPDFLLCNSKIIADAKYKTYHKESIKGIDQWKRDAIVNDIRQLSGYARDRNVLEKLGFFDKQKQDETLVKCLIIYPDQDADEDMSKNTEVPIEGFTAFYKLPLKLPEI